MSWIFRNKLVVLLVIAGAAYFFVNPPNRFGIVRKGFVVYNRIPVCSFDCSIDPKGKLYLEADLRIKSNITYWFENHVPGHYNESGGMLPLLVGTGFGDSVEIKFSQELVKKCRRRGLEPHFYTSREAIDRYNTLRDEKSAAALLLKVM